MKREIIRALVRRVEIDKQEVTVVFRVGPDPSGLTPEKQSSQHCWRGERRAPMKGGGAKNAFTFRWLTVKYPSFSLDYKTVQARPTAAAFRRMSLAV